MFTVDVVRSVQAALDLREVLTKLTEENEDLRRLARRAEVAAAFAEEDLRLFRERTEVEKLLIQERLQEQREALTNRRCRRRERVETGFRRRTHAKQAALSAISEALESARAKLPANLLDEVDEALERVRDHQALLRTRTARSYRRSLRILWANPSASAKEFQETLDALRKLDEE